MVYEICKTKNDEIRKILQDCEVLFDKLIKKAKDDYYKKMFSKCQVSFKRTGQIIKEITCQRESTILFTMHSNIE